MTISIDDFEELRRLIPERPDFHLHNWGVWSRGDKGVSGYREKDVLIQNLGGVSSPDASDHVYENELGFWAEVSDVVIRGLPLPLRTAISSTYEASVWHERTPELRKKFLIDGARRFWIEASRRGLT